MAGGLGVGPPPPSSLPPRGHQGPGRAPGPPRWGAPGRPRPLHRPRGRRIPAVPPDRGPAAVAGGSARGMVGRGAGGGRVCRGFSRAGGAGRRGSHRRAASPAAAPSLFPASPLPAPRRPRNGCLEVRSPRGQSILGDCRGGRRCWVGVGLADAPPDVGAGGRGRTGASRGTVGG